MIYAPIGTNKVFILSAIIILVLTGYSDSASIINVPINYATIQEAIDASSPGCTIEIHRDREVDAYRESLIVTKPILLKGVSLEGKMPVVDSSDIGSAITVKSDNVTIENIKIVNSGKLHDETGIMILSKNNTIRNNEIGINDGYGIYLKGSRENNIINNTISNNRWGICVDDSIANTITKNKVRSNYMGIWIRNSINNIVEQNNISYNHYGIGYDIESFFSNAVENNQENGNDVNQQDDSKISNDI